jgi:hypothetical protein
VSRARLDLQRATQSLQPVLHVGQPSAPDGTGHIETAAVVGDLDKQLAAILGKRTVAFEARAYFCTFCRASRVQKYRAASISCG